MRSPITCTFRLSNMNEHALIHMPKYDQYQYFENWVELLFEADQKFEWNWWSKTK